jgi:multidrug efflux pump
MALTEATLEASRTRLRPIIMTSFAFIFGVFLLVIARGAGGEMRQTLGTAVFSGMIGVTGFGIFLTPVFYYAIMRLADPGVAGPSGEKVTENVQEAIADGSYGKKCAVEQPVQETKEGPR